MAAKVDPVDREYFEQVVGPVLAKSPHVEFVGEIDDDMKQEFLGNARALLFPIRWPEPFGLVMIEAMACGTPVVAFRNGSVPEVLEDGVTGFAVDKVEEAVRALDRLDQLPRAAVRARFETRFSAGAMAQSYCEIYKRLIESSSPALEIVQAA